MGYFLMMNFEIFEVDPPFIRTVQYAVGILGRERQEQKTLLFLKSHRGSISQLNSAFNKY